MHIPANLHRAAGAVLLATLAACASAPTAVATKPCAMPEVALDQLAAAIQSRTPAANPAEGLADAEGACIRAQLNRRLAQRHGPVVGYKAGLTNPAVQKRFNTDRPVWGTLYADMLLANGATVDAGFGARPLYEADMLVRVKSADINRAKTPAEVLAAIDQVIPFVELPDLVVQTPGKLNGAGVAAINVGARLGVRGTPVAVPAGAAERTAMLQQLGTMSVVLRDGAGTELARGKGSDILEHPLNAVVWLAGALAQEGLALQPGQLVSLGSFSPLLPPKPGLAVSASFEGLAGAQPVRVQFR
jgi:2-keto-4-pentenoate hydratase